MSSLPLPVRVLNLAGRSARAAGWQPVSLDFDKLLNKARDNTGLNDFGEDDFRDPLKLLLNGLETEARLSTLGRIVARSDLLRTLENRLGLVDLLRKHPEIEEQTVERPLFVVGPPRSGTTIFHDLLAMDADNRQITNKLSSSHALAQKHFESATSTIDGTTIEGTSATATRWHTDRCTLGENHRHGSSMIPDFWF